jgi:hypothetical protein
MLHRYALGDLTYSLEQSTCKAPLVHSCTFIAKTGTIRFSLVLRDA